MPLQTHFVYNEAITIQIYKMAFLQDFESHAKPLWHFVYILEREQLLQMPWFV